MGGEYFDFDGRTYRLIDGRWHVMVIDHADVDDEGACLHNWEVVPSVALIPSVARGAQQGNHTQWSEP